MKITVDRMPKSVVAIDIVADPDEFATAVDKTMREVSRDAAIPGFRKGKAPRHIIERMVGRDAIVAEAGRSIMDDLYQRALEQEELQPISEPAVDIYNEEPIAFKVVVEVFPTVELGDYKSVKVETREVALEEGDTEDELEALLKNHAEWIDVEDPRHPQDGDEVTIDLEVYEGDEQFQDPATDATFVLGESNLFDSLVEAMKMMMPGTSSELTLAFEEDDETVRPTMRGKTLRYALTLKKIRVRDMPELDDEFAAQVGEFESLDEMREALEEDVLRNKARVARTEVYNEIIDSIVELSDVQVPDTLINSEIDDQLTQLRTRLAQQGVSFEDYLSSNGQSEADVRFEMRENAGDRVRSTLVLQEVAKAEGLEVTQEDIDAEIDKLVAGQANADQMRSLYASDYFRGMLENELHDRKLMELVVGLATDGNGAISGPGADLLESDENPEPVEEDEEYEVEAAAEDATTDDDAADVEMSNADGDDAAEAADEEPEEAQAEAGEEDDNAESPTETDDDEDESSR